MTSLSEPHSPRHGPRLHRPQCTRADGVHARAERDPRMTNEPNYGRFSPKNMTWNRKQTQSDAAVPSNCPVKGAQTDIPNPEYASSSAHQGRGVPAPNEPNYGGFSPGGAIWHRERTESDANAASGCSAENGNAGMPGPESARSSTGRSRGARAPNEPNYGSSGFWVLVDRQRVTTGDAVPGPLAFVAFRQQHGPYHRTAAAPGVPADRAGFQTRYVVFGVPTYPPQQQSQSPCDGRWRQEASRSYVSCYWPDATNAGGLGARDIPVSP